MARTETVTVVFTDLVGSTELASRLGHDRYEALRQGHFTALRAALAKHGGAEVKTTGDGLMLRFDSAAGAIACAVAMQQAADGAARHADSQPLHIRVGVSSGEATREDDDLYGPPVVEAARLCASARAGQILAADVVRTLARGKGHRFTSVGELTLKGLPEPVAACEVAWEPAPAGIPLPPRLAIAPQVIMVGREAEQEALSEAWGRAKGGRRQVVLLYGEPGIGKTRLASEAARAAHGEGGVVLLGACDEDVNLPYQPFVEALRHYVTHASDEMLTAHVGEHKGELGRLVPELGRRIAGLPTPQVAEAETERYLLFEAVTGLLSAASQQQPIVLFLDDLQWAGAPELLLLKHILRTGMPLRLLVTGTYRDTDLTRGHPLTAVLADLRREAGVERLALGGLDETAVVNLVGAAAGHRLTEPGIALAQAIYRETEGSPFFIGEILRHLTESGAVFQKGDRWTYEGDIAGLGIPEGIKEVIGRRLARLAETTNKVLTLAAVIGRQFDLPLLVRVAEVPEEAVLDALDEATAAVLIAEVPGSPECFSFSHALIRTTLYEKLGSARRARLHRKVGEVLEELTGVADGARIDELAHHWLNARQMADANKAIGYARRAGNNALANLAFEEAAALYERALGLLEPKDRASAELRCDLLLALADAQRRAGNQGYRETVAKAVEGARALADGEWLARAALASARPGGWMANANVVDQELIALYEEARAALGEADGLLRARVLGQLAVELGSSPQRERRDALSREAIAIARRINDRNGLAQVLILRLIAMNDPFTLAERLDHTAELAALAGELGSSELAWHAMLHRTAALLESGDSAGAEVALTEVERLTGELRQPFYAWVARLGRSMLAVLRGAQDAEAEVIATSELGIAGGQPDAGLAAYPQLFMLRYDQGRLGEFADAERAIVEAQPHVPGHRAALARLYSETGQLLHAREQLDVLRAGGLVHPPDWAWATYMARLSEVVCDFGDRAAAAALYDGLRPVAKQVHVLMVILCEGSWAHWCGMLAACCGRWDDAEGHFTDALAMNERLGARPCAVRTRRAWASMLLDRDAPGDRERAAELIAAGRAEAEPLSMAREIVHFERLRERMA